MRDDLENYRAALRWLIERGRPAEASSIAWGLKYFWLIRGHAAEGLQWYQEILNLPFLGPAAELRALEGAAVLWYTQGELERARTGLTRALALAHAVDMETVVRAEDLSARVEHALGNLKAARDRFALAVDGFRSLGLTWGTGNALSGMASVALATGDVELAEDLLDEAMPVLQQVGPWFRPGPCIFALSWRSGAGTPMTRSRSCVRASPASGSPGQVRVRIHAGPSCRRRGAQRQRRVGGADPGRPGRRQRAHRGDRGPQIGARPPGAVGTGGSCPPWPDRWAGAYAAGRGTSFDALLKHIDHVLREG